jgi:hypothetical protein
VEAVLTDHGYASPIDVLTGLGWLQQRRVHEWRRGQLDCLEQATTVDEEKLSDAMRLFRRFAHGRGLVPSETAYRSRTRDGGNLRFSVSGEAATPDVERVLERWRQAPASGC